MNLFMHLSFKYCISVYLIDLDFSLNVLMCNKMYRIGPAKNSLRDFLFEWLDICASILKINNTLVSLAKVLTKCELDNKFRDISVEAHC